ncbi:MAG: flagellar hook-associated protein FlgK [Peptococcaceae bacterium]|nr:flagellar hook-associated protein FlgK [Peptococcaceae bacterium]
MMRSTFFGLEIARRALQAQRTSMDVAAHNLANANNEGYTRQDAVHSATNPYTIPTRTQKVTPGQIGTGVEVTEIRRVRDEILDRQVRSALSDAGYWESRQLALERVEAVFPEPSEYGLQKVIGKFFDNWHDLNNSPDDLGLKAAVVEGGRELASMIREAYVQLEDQQQGLKDHLENYVVKQINSLAAQLQDINNSLTKLGAAGHKANDLLDRRDLVLDKLAELGPITVEENDADHTVKVYMFGLELKDVDSNGEFVSGAVDSTDDKFKLTFESAPSSKVVVSDYHTGAIAGWEQARQDIKGYMDDLDKLSAALINKVNAEHTANGAPEFFAGNGANDITVNSALVGDPSQVDGSVALNIAGLRDDKFDDLDADLNNQTFEQFYAGLVTKIGADVEGAGERMAGSKAVRDQLENLRQSVIGVSIDEELTKLTQYQYAYQAAAHVVTMIDEMLDTIIDRMI